MLNQHNMINKIILYVVFIILVNTIDSKSQVKDDVFRKEISKIIKIRPDKLDRMYLPEYRGRAFIFSVLIRVNEKGKADQVQFNYTSELLDFFENTEIEEKIKLLNLSRYKNKDLWLPYLLKNMDDDSIKNGLNKDFEAQWYSLIPKNLNDSKGHLLFFVPEIYSFKTLPPKKAFEN